MNLSLKKIGVGEEEQSLRDLKQLREDVEDTLANLISTHRDAGLIDLLEYYGEGNDISELQQAAQRLDDSEFQSVLERISQVSQEMDEVENLLNTIFDRYFRGGSLGYELNEEWKEKLRR